MQDRAPFTLNFQHDDHSRPMNEGFWLRLGLWAFIGWCLLWWLIGTGVVDP
jgi:hypothetical protein